MKRLFTTFVAATFSLGAIGVLAQSTDAAKADPAKTEKAKKVEDFAAKEKAIQDASRSSASGTGATPPPAEAKKQMEQLMQWVRKLGHGELRIESAVKEYRLDLEWQMKK